MVIYSEEDSTGLLAYGITIPVHESRARRTFDRLLAHPVLGPRRGEWHLRHAGERIGREDLRRAHSAAYVDRLYSDGLEEEIIRTFELRDSAGRPYRYDPALATRPLGGLRDTAIHEAAGTLQCCTVALREGFCYYLSGGLHHAHWDMGKGFCLLNDGVIALRRLQADGRIRTAWVIDVDAHKGDGTAAITAGDESIRTLSIHMACGWPLDEPPVDEAGRPNPSFIPSDIDIPIEEGEEGRYVPRLAQGLQELGRMPRPDLALVIGGADPYEHDELPSTRLLRLTLEQILERDRLVYTTLRDSRIPGAWVMAGGYGERSWEVYYQFLEWVLLERLRGAAGRRAGGP